MLLLLQKFSFQATLIGDTLGVPSFDFLLCGKGSKLASSTGRFASSLLFSYHFNRMSSLQNVSEF
jgi:hypothetical protein